LTVPADLLENVDKHVREHLLRDKLISPDDLNLYQITDNTDEAVKIIARSTATSIRRGS